MSSELTPRLERIKAFNQERDWAKFHNPKDLAISLVLEATEVLEHFQWKSASEMREHLESNKVEVGEELADVLIYLLMMGDYFGIDLLTAIDQKLDKNESKYPAVKATDKFKRFKDNN